MGHTSHRSWPLENGSRAYLTEAEVKEFPMAGSETQKAKEDAEERIRRIKNMEFPARLRDSDFCEGCEYWEICRDRV